VRACVSGVPVKQQQAGRRAPADPAALARRWGAEMATLTAGPETARFARMPERAVSGGALSCCCFPRRFRARAACSAAVALHGWHGCPANMTCSDDRGKLQRGPGERDARVFMHPALASASTSGEDPSPS
jgi:hypothetical protein